MFSKVEEESAEGEPGRQTLRIEPPGNEDGWAVAERPQAGTQGPALLIHGPAGGVIVPLNEVQSLREALAEAAARLAAREAEAKVNGAGGR